MSQPPDVKPVTSAGPPGAGLPRSVVFWYNAPPVHHYALLRALADRDRMRVTVVTARDLLHHRRRMGWTDPDFGSVTRVHRPDTRAIEHLLAEHADADSLHVFSGIHAFPPVYAAFERAVRTRARVGVIAIQPDPRGLTGIGRRLLYAMHAARYRDRIDVFLAVGRNAVRWYRSVGFHERSLYPFGNFSEPPPAGTTLRHADAGAFSLLYIGELIPLKGVATLLDALQGLPSIPWRLEVVGEGPSLPGLRARADRLGIAQEVRWTSFIPHADIYEKLAGADLLVLPSATDGWGSVINEALSAGVPVVCSDECGAADVVLASERGAVFEAGSITDLRARLEKLLRQGRPAQAERDALAKWASRLSPDAGAEYLERIIEHAFASGAAPVPPWRVG